MAMLASTASGSADTERCCVCLEEKDWRGTALLQCQHCRIRVHVQCYGVSVAADTAAWICEACAVRQQIVASKSKTPGVAPPFCAVCPVEGGALRETNQRGVWCHVLCMQWIPELSHSLTGELDEALDIAKLDRSREHLRCLVCGLRGGCIQCVTGRCARAFHVICALRAPSAVVFTGYNNENQQVYHCRTHINDVASRQFEMVDDSWRRNPRVIALLEKAAATSVPGRCRICNNKLPNTQPELHEAQCLLGWLTRQEWQDRKTKLDAMGVSIPKIAYDGANGPTSSGATAERDGRPGTPTRKKRSPVMKVCPHCDERVREADFIDHIKHRCSKNKEKADEGIARMSKQPGILKRRLSGVGSEAANREPNGVRADAPVAGEAVADLSDVLFATWPGQLAGSLLDTTSFWKILQAHFFSSKVLLRSRMEPLSRKVCGARLEDIGSMVLKSRSFDALSCSDALSFKRRLNESGGPASVLSLSKSNHKCDFVLRHGHMHCETDPLSHANLELTSSQSNDDSLGGQPDQITVVFRNAEGTALKCEFGFHAGSSISKDEDKQVWSRFHHDSIATLRGAELESCCLSSECAQDLWVSLSSISECEESRPPMERKDIDELTPELNLLVDKLNTQLRRNRLRMRPLCFSVQAHDNVQPEIERQVTTTELYYRQYSAWKVLCKSLLTGFHNFGLPTKIVPEETKNGKHGEHKHEETAEEEEDIDDGTCVVCFDGQSPESNPIVFCDRCDLAVHQRCYGIRHVPRNEYYCDRCLAAEETKNDPQDDVFCQLCSLRDGAFKRTADGKWVHVVCALWCPGAWIGNLQDLSDIHLNGGQRSVRFQDTLREIDELTSEASSSIKSVQDVESQALQPGALCRGCRVACGQTVCCCEAGCAVSYHPLCAWFAGLPMKVDLKDNRFLYHGGGGGLAFQFYCDCHRPDHYTSEIQQEQRRRRRRFRVDRYFSMQKKNVFLLSAHDASVSSPKSDQELDDRRILHEYVDQELCTACFEYNAPVMAKHADTAELSSQQWMLRCHECNTYVHAGCCISASIVASQSQQHRWTCERCQSGRAEKASQQCLLCERQNEYLMPCVLQPKHLALEPNGSMVSSNGESSSKASATTDRGSLPAGSALDESTAQSAKFQPKSEWIHVFCAKWAHAKTWKRGEVLCADPPSPPSDITGRCELCQRKGPHLVSCGHCSKRFHANCAARAKFFVQRSNKNAWKFYCRSHASVIGAAFDEKRQAWLTADTLAHLQELRHMLERGRMVIEMARQRDRQKKRLLNICVFRKMELAMEMVLKKRPTVTMKEVFEEYTGDTLVDVPKRERPTRASPKKRRTLPSRQARHDDDASVPSPEQVEMETPRKRRRVGSKGEHTPIDEDKKEMISPSRRSSRRLFQEGNEPATSESRRTMRQQTLFESNAMKREDADVDDDATSSSPSKRTRASLREKKEFNLLAALMDVTYERDFDGIAEAMFPELVGRAMRDDQD